MNLYQPLAGRWYVQFDWADPSHGFRLAIGRWPKGETLVNLSNYRTRMADEYAADDDFGQPRMGAEWRGASYPNTYPHYADAEALQYGSPVSPVGAQSGEVIDVTKGPYVPNWPSNEDGS